MTSKKIIGDVKKQPLLLTKFVKVGKKLIKFKEALFKNGEKLVAAAEKLTEDDNSKKAGNSRALMESATQVK